MLPSLWRLKLLPLAVVLLLNTLALAWGGERVNVPTRPDVKTSVFWHVTEGATATLLIFPGGVVTSSVVAYKKAGALPRQDLNRIRLPMLVYHHAKDACDVCQPHEVSAVLAALTHSPVKKLMMVSGGADPSGSPCEAKHWHGFIGMEAQAVSSISAWIKNPVK